MRRRGWLATWSISLTACLAAGCLRATVPPEPQKLQADNPPRGREESSEEPAPTDQKMSNYLLSQAPTIKPNAPVAAPSFKAVDLRIKEDAPPVRPADPPEPRLEVQSAPPPARPDAPSVCALRALLEHDSEEEVREHLKRCDPVTRETLHGLLDSVAQLERSGGVTHLSPDGLAAWMDRLNALTIPLRPRAQLMLDRVCFCNCIESFGKYQTRPLNPPSFQPGEEARIYVQVRNFASRQEGEFHKTILKARLEIFDESNRASPFYRANIKSQPDCSRTPRQDFFVYIRFHVPHSCPPGSYTMWVTVEDWTDAPEGAKTVAKSRIDRKSLDFRVGGPSSRPSQATIADVAPAR
ncbi:MAG TPA: hypothetical protein VH643_10190 [Gemmataceae bacterium]|jgi:hypothetical protein